MNTDTSGSLITANMLGDALRCRPARHGVVEVRDDYGGIYTGPPSHMALYSFLRKDLSASARLDGDITIRRMVTDAAHLMATWFTSPAVPKRHRETFDTLSANRVCALLAHVAVYGDRRVLVQVGPATLSTYTGYLLSDEIDLDSNGFPEVVDAYPTVHTVSPTLNIEASTNDGADTLVTVPVRAKVRETTTDVVNGPIKVSPSEFSRLMTDPFALEEYLDDHLPLVEDALHSSPHRTREIIAAAVEKPHSSADQPTT